jgi:hypothetical protein
VKLESCTRYLLLSQLQHTLRCKQSVYCSGPYAALQLPTVFLCKLQQDTSRLSALRATHQTHTVSQLDFTQALLTNHNNTPLAVLLLLAGC